MFEFIQGKLVSRGTDYCVIQVGGIGFKIFTDLRTSVSLGNEGDEVTVYTYLQVKEDDLSLFGFASREELSIFELLISVNGVGPKMALSVLSALTPSDFSIAVTKGDFKAISTAKGVGVKLAQRMILELKDKVRADMSAAVPEETEILPKDGDGIIQEAVSALVVLGYRAQEARKAAKSAYEDGISLENLVKSSLRNLMK